MKKWKVCVLVAIAFYIGSRIGWSSKAVWFLGFEPPYLNNFVTTLATVALVWVTWRYVKLSHRLAVAAEKQMESSEKQLKFLIEQAQTARRGQGIALDAICRILLAGISEVKRSADSRHFRQAVIQWNDEHLQSLNQLAPALGADEARRAAAVTGNLRWVGDKIRFIQGLGVSQSSGQDHLYFEGGEKRLSEAEENLKVLLDRCGTLLHPLDRFYLGDESSGSVLPDRINLPSRST